MNRNTTALILAITIVVVGLAAVGPLAPLIRTAIGLLLVLVVPGYALVAALFPIRALGRIETLLFSLGASMGVAAVGGVLLNLTPWGLQTASWAVLLGAITLGSIAVAFRRRALPWSAPPAATRSFTPPSLSSILLLISAALVVIAATRVSVNGEAQQIGPGYTQLWLLPVPAHASRIRTIQLGITNDEVATTRYTLVLAIHGRTLRTWPAINLAPGRTWQMKMNLPSIVAPNDRVQATLYRARAPRTIYRQVWLQHDQ